MTIETTGLIAARVLGLAHDNLEVAADQDDLRAGLGAEVLHRLRDLPAEDLGERLWMIQGALDTWMRAARLARAAVDQLLIADIKARGDVRFGDAGYRIAPSRSRKIVDVDQLVAWARDAGGPDALAQIFRLGDDNVRVTAVRAIAERWIRSQGGGPLAELSDDEVKAYCDAVEQTHFEWVDVDGGERLDSIPATKAKWVAGLEHGQRRPR